MSLMIWGHRGHRHHRYNGYRKPPHENSLKAYQQSLESVMGVECDVVQSKLRTPYLVHDTLFNGMVQYALANHLDAKGIESADNRFIFQLSDAELDLIKLKDGQALPRLRRVLELLARFPDRYLNLELKGPNVADAALRAVERAIQDNLIDVDQIVFSSFNLPALREVRDMAGDRFKLAALFAPTEHPLSAMYPNWPNAEIDAYYVPFTADIFTRSDIQDIKPDYFSVERASLSTALIETLEEAFPLAKIILWMAGEAHPEQSSQLIDAVTYYAPTRKIHAVLSDFPEAVQKCLIDRNVDVSVPWDPFETMPFETMPAAAIQD